MTHPPGAGRCFRLRTLLAAIAVTAALLGVFTPRIKRALGYPNTWVVRTVTLPDGTVIRQRIRRHPDRDAVFEEVLSGPGRPAVGSVHGGDGG